MNNKEFVSSISGSIKAKNKDGRISDRLILSIAKTKVEFLVAQKMRDLSLTRELGMISPVPCFEMQPVEYKDCGIVEFRLCENIMRSKKNLPKLPYGKIANGVVRVYSLDDEYSFEYITPRGYQGLKKRRYSRKNKHYYTIKDNYLWLLNSEVEMVEMDIISMDDTETKKLSSCIDNSCNNRWNDEFKCPDRFLKLVREETLQEVASLYTAIPEDENPNLDSNQKSQTQE